MSESDGSVRFVRRARAAKVTAPEPETAAARVSRKGCKRTPELEVALGARIRAARVAAHMSQGALGDAIGISFQQVQKYELGRDRVAASTLQGIASALGVHPGSFFGDDIPMAPRNIVDVRATMEVGERIQRLRSPSVLKRLLALVETIAAAEGEEGQGRPLDGEGGSSKAERPSTHERRTPRAR